MISFVLGKQNSGKSELAEKLALQSGDDRRYYVATMKILDEAGRQRVQKHREKRAGKGFITIECEYDILSVLDKTDAPAETTVLLECVSNLVGNEIYENSARAERMTKGELSEEGFADEIAAEIKKFSEKLHNIIIVSNEYESDAQGYDDETRAYVRMLDMVNERISRYSDRIYDLRKG